MLLLLWLLQMNPSTIAEYATAATTHLISQRAQLTQPFLFLRRTDLWRRLTAISCIRWTCKGHTIDQYGIIIAQALGQPANLNQNITHYYMYMCI